MRGGVGYEISPITDQVRTPRLPDNDRFWASVGLSWKIAPFMRFDLAYTHLFDKGPEHQYFRRIGESVVQRLDHLYRHRRCPQRHIFASLVVRFDDLEPAVKKPFMK